VTKRLNHLREDRALRDTAKALLLANVESMRGFFEVNANRDRLAKRATDEARELANEAGKAASDHKGALAFLAAAIFLWFGRDEIISLLNRSDKPSDNGAESEELIKEAEIETAIPEIEEAL